MSESVAIAKIRDAFDRAVSSGLDPAEVCGATDSEIDQMALIQKASAVPAAAREMLRLIGKRYGKFQIVGDFDIDALDEEWKSMVLEFLEQTPKDKNPLSDPERMLVIMDSMGAHAAVVDGADLAKPDPPVWGIAEDGEITPYGSVTSFFAAMVDSVQDLIEQSRGARELRER
ncbi:hypothetical protein [Nocardia sp. R7R-8]|uniref:hypothetical protein n=1 Tax=Nocardia sp. R7R-8 TaxID=3459304 RepID=UPI00403E1CAE